jgi:23S rRNA (uracil1939-C5)-methyltransferase
MGRPVEMTVERVVAGALGLGHEPDGRVVRAAGGLPGERVVVELLEERPRVARGDVVEVLEPSPGRVAPPCGRLAEGCGGCDLQHAAAELQAQLKADIVRDALAHLGGFDDLPVDPGRPLDPSGHRTTVRCGVVDGRAAFHRRRSEDLVTAEGCLVAHPLVREVLDDGRFPGATGVVVRAGAATGERLVVVSPSVGDGVEVPAGVRVVGADELRAGRRAWYHEEVAGRRFRISARSFFQARPDGAAALADAVRRALDDVDPATDRLADLYGGVGLFTALLGARRSVLVERSAASVADARVNLADLDTSTVRVAVERWHPSPADGVVADPARSGLGRPGADAVAATGARQVALVSCDPASLARDLGLLAERGYEAVGVELVDLFPHTHHVEAVTALRRR